MTELRKALEHFDESHVGLSKGSLSLVLTLTRNFASMSFPLQKAEFVTAKGGQVAGLGGGVLRKILKEHGIDRVLSSEGGRTSRGNMERMEAYVDLLNELSRRNIIDFHVIEEFWIGKVLEYFDAQPFQFRLDTAHSLRTSVRNLLDQAVERQREVKGTMYAGAVMQHLVGAKLAYISKDEISHHGFSVADSPSNRSGDFLLGDVSIHVTTAPSEALILKCRDNLGSGLRPIVVTTEDGIGGARALARQYAIDERIDIIEIEQFVATNVYEWSGFDRTRRPSAVREILQRYNEIVSACESDPSLRIEFEE